MYTSSIFSQIEESPIKYSKIYFTYTKKSNYYFTDKGIYADTLLLKIDLPNKKFTLTKFPNNDSITAGFIPIDELTKNDNTILSNSASRNFSTTEVVFDVKKRKATITKIFTDTRISF